MPRFRPYAIVCAELSHLSPEENIARTAMAAAFLRSMRVPHKRTIGKYKGEVEHGFIIYGDRAQHIAAMITRAFQQETYLLCDMPTCAALWRLDGTIAALFHQCVEGTGDNYTQIGNGAPFRWV